MAGVCFSAIQLVNRQNTSCVGRERQCMKYLITVPPLAAGLALVEVEVEKKHAEQNDEEAF